ncbi:MULTISPECIES: MFS transporter [unclassified Cryobacterium]|uniref:MFS transporter n=1 Tax=unclassified Cryobacterium TaxID=2649013 RepID=UPI00106CCAF7|nr:MULTISPECIES: MFS transporter [unclassified Cryobacterium]TFB99272.1 MFS transporter [Cryobacterium sp. MDB2-A-1]TFC02165.1 MFS transporter [Cryobacterium sp. MDB2-33-2]TFC15891.1 MFS transporter [Cryobacterium sp. MDB2-A-2]TFC16128.1 MFS transporter [Cryobacterium sp. MDB2-10]
MSNQNELSNPTNDSRISSDRHRPQTLRAAAVALAGLSAVFLFEMLDNSILNVALPTIGRELDASTTALQWVTGAYAVVFGGLMLLFSAIADRFGRRRVMLIGLGVLGVASLATALVTTTEQLIAVRVAMGIAAAMTTPGSMALAFRLFDDENLRVRAITLISTVGLVGLAIGPTVGGFILAVAPWQVLLLINAPIAVLAFIGIRIGIARDLPAELHRDPLDIAGAFLGTATIVLALVAPTLFVGEGAGSWTPWAATAGAVIAAILFVVRERTARYPLLDLKLIALPLVSSGLAYKAASGLAISGLSYMVTLQLQFSWGWPPALAAIGMLPQVIVLLGGGRLVGPFVARFGMDRAAWMSAAAVVLGLAVFAAGSRFGYVWVALSLVLVAAGMRVVGVVAGTNVMRGLPKNRTTIGAALVDTSSQVATGVGIAVTGTILAALFTGNISASNWSADQAAAFQTGVTVAGVTLTAVAGALVLVGIARSRPARDIL